MSNTFHDWTLSSAGNPKAEPGSTEWAVFARGQLQSLLEERESSIEHLSYAYDAMIKYEGWRHLYAQTKRPFNSFEHFCFEAKPWGLGYKREVIEQIIHDRKTAQQQAANAAPLAGTGRPKKGTSLVPLSKGGNDRLVAQIAARRPDIHRRMLADEYRSVRAAAIDAGIIRIDPPVEKIKKLWLKMTPDEKEQFQVWALEQL